ncbi:MAG: hypothetical protein HZB67_02465 [Candidatus Aenigmarchaeota archaeon]|nr:hypothetical protein [Candidatus Aenigmarchaeota archaeon]
MISETKNVFEIDCNIGENIKTKNVCVVQFPVSVCRIKKSLMYTDVLGYKHPVMVHKNHFTLPIEVQEILKGKDLLNSMQKIQLKQIDRNGQYFYMGNFGRNKPCDKKYRYVITIDKKIGNLLNLKEKNIIEIKIDKHGPFYGRVRLQSNKNTMFIFFPKRIFEILNLKINEPYQIEIKKTRKKNVSNDHFYSTEKNKLLFSKFYDGKYFDLYRFLSESYAQSRVGKIRKYKIYPINKNTMSVYYCSTAASKKIKIAPKILIDANFFRVFGLIQAEASKSFRKPFCFTCNDPQIIEYVVNWFESYMRYSKKDWTYELAIDPRIKKPSKAIEFWSNSLKIETCFIKTYSKYSNTINPKENGIMNIRGNRTIKQIVLRLLESIKNYVNQNEFAAGYFLAGVLGGDGCVNITQNNLNHVTICFDPNKIWEEDNELLVYINCLKAIDVPTDDLKIYITKHEKTRKFIQKVRKYGIRVRAHKGGSLGFGGELNIFKYRSLEKLSSFNPFYPNKNNMTKFFDGFNRINKNRVKFR